MFGTDGAIWGRFESMWRALDAAVQSPKFGKLERG